MVRTGVFLFVFLAFITIIATAPAVAQGDGDPSLQARIELARKMHEIKPLSVQINDAVRQLSQRYPEDKRELFVSRMLQTFDQKTLTEISVKAMAETFTEAELEKMIDFHGSPEGKAITEKMTVYQSIIEPELIKKIDGALMEIRTGKISD